MLNFKIFLEMSPINIPKRGLYKKGSFDCLRPACNKHFYCCNWRFTDGKFMKESGKLFTIELTRNSRTPQYNQLSPCEHLAITDTPPLRTRARPPAKRIKK